MVSFLLIQIVLAFFCGSVVGSRTHRSTGGTEYTEAEQKSMVEDHNYFRANVDPPASNMKEMVWDQELAAQAQDWADLCVFYHPSKKEHPDYKGIGQNMFMMKSKSGKRPSTYKVTKAWYNEVKNYNISAGGCTPGKVCGHFTQVVWAKTTNVGCGIKFCPELLKKTGDAFTNSWVVACNYSPAGNYVGALPYIPGNPCSECKDGQRCRNNLCTDCNKDEENCECKLECKNCGITDTDACQCSCPDGYYGEFCGTYCEDKSANCGEKLKSKFCNKRPNVDKQCPLMCGHCIPGPVVDSTSC